MYRESCGHALGVPRTCTGGFGNLAHNRGLATRTGGLPTHNGVPVDTYQGSCDAYRRSRGHILRVSRTYIGGLATHRASCRHLAEVQRLVPRRPAAPMHGKL